MPIKIDKLWGQKQSRRERERERERVKQGCLDVMDANENFPSAS